MSVPDVSLFLPWEQDTLVITGGSDTLCVSDYLLHLTVGSWVSPAPLPASVFPSVTGRLNCLSGSPLHVLEELLKHRTRNCKKIKMLLFSKLDFRKPIYSNVYTVRLIPTHSVPLPPLSFVAKVINFAQTLRQYSEAFNNCHHL